MRLDLDENGVEGVAVTAIRGIFRSVQMEVFSDIRIQKHFLIFQ